MKWLKKKNTAGQSGENDRVAQKIASWVIIIQGKWSSWMNRQSNKCPPKLRSALLIIFLFAMAAVSISMIMGGFKRNSRLMANIDTIKVPAIIQKQGNAFREFSSDTVYQRIRSYKKHLDNLAQTEAGSIKLDSINKLRPGLRDSINMVELLYKQLKQGYEN